MSYLNLTDSVLYNLQVERNKLLDKTFITEVLTATGVTSFNFSGYSAILLVKQKPNDYSEVLRFTTADNSIVLSDEGQFKLTKSSTLMNIKKGEYVYEMYLINNNNSRGFIRGKFIVLDQSSQQAVESNYSDVSPIRLTVKNINSGGGSGGGFQRTDFWKLTGTTTLDNNVTVVGTSIDFNIDQFNISTNDLSINTHTTLFNATGGTAIVDNNYIHLHNGNSDGLKILSGGTTLISSGDIDITANSSIITIEGHAGVSLLSDWGTFIINENEKKLTGLQQLQSGYYISIDPDTGNLGYGSDGGNTYTAGNGLSLVGGNKLVLGGTVTGNTSINVDDSYSFEIKASDNSINISENGLNINSNSIVIDADSISVNPNTFGIAATEFITLQTNTDTTSSLLFLDDNSTRLEFNDKHIILSDDGIQLGGIENSSTQHSLNIDSSTGKLYYTESTGFNLVIATTSTLLGDNSNQTVICNATSGITITLPELPFNKQTIRIKDGAGNALTHNITIDGNEFDIDSSSTANINTNHGSLEFMFILDLNKWVVLSFVN